MILLWSGENGVTASLTNVIKGFIEVGRDAMVSLANGAKGFIVFWGYVMVSLRPQAPLAAAVVAVLLNPFRPFVG